MSHWRAGVALLAVATSLTTSSLAKASAVVPLQNFNCFDILQRSVGQDKWLSTLHWVLGVHDLKSEPLRLGTPLEGQHSETMKLKRNVNRAVHSQLQSTPQIVSGVQSLIYPAAGFDSSTPFQILDDLRVVIGIDDHAFFSRPIGAAIEPSLGPEDHKETYLLPGSNQVDQQFLGFTHYSRADLIRSFADVIVGRILSLSPDVRIREVRGFYPAHFREQSRWNEMPHGLVTFDFGDGTPLRSYIHLQLQTLRNSQERTTSPEGHAQIERLAQLEFDALLAKGSQGFFSSANSNHGARALIASLLQRNGLWLDGNGKTNDPVSFSPTSIRVLLQAWGLEGRCPLIRTPIRGFGYGQFEYCRLQSPGTR